VGAVPGRISSPLVHGPHELLRRGALLVDGVEPILEILFGSGYEAEIPRPDPALDDLDPVQRAVLDALAAGSDTARALAQVGCSPEAGLAVLAGLELSGLVVRRPGGGYAVPLWTRSR
jgi:predicted Rossmann fold nucleotide-binding protein DprA/Smf involved in DNA uptake